MGDIDFDTIMARVREESGRESAELSKQLDESDWASEWSAATADAETQASRGLAYYKAEDRAKAEQCWRAAAEQGHVSSQFLLADLHLERASKLRGTGDHSEDGARAEEYTAALRYLRSAATAGHVQAKYWLGDFLNTDQIFQRPIAHNDAEAARWYRSCGEIGYAGAMTRLADMYTEGRGVVQSGAEALRWYRLAAAKGSEDAQRTLAFQYTNGDGVPQDFVEAAKWWKSAADQNRRKHDRLARHTPMGEFWDDAITLGWLCENADSGCPIALASLAAFCEAALAEARQAAANKASGIKYYRSDLMPWRGGFSLGGGCLHLLRDSEGAMRLVREAAEGGIANAQALMGLVWLLGLIAYRYSGDDKHRVETYRWLQQAAEQGVAIAQRQFAYACERGEGVERSVRKAAYWYRRAAEQGDAESQFALASLFGLVAERKANVVAAQWYSRAASSGHARAQFKLAERFAEGRGVKRDLGKAVHWYKRSADLGHDDAQYALGCLHYRDEESHASDGGPPHNPTRAAFWFGKAAEQGHQGAQQELALMYSEGIGVQKDGAQSAIWHRRALQSRG